MKYSDENDRASFLEEAARQAEINRIRAEAATRALLPTGVCYNCESEVPWPKLFCDRECADEHAQFQEQRRRAGSA